LASTKNVIGVYPTWVSAVKKKGRRVHRVRKSRAMADSKKLYDPTALRGRHLEGDIIALWITLRHRARDVQGLFAGDRGWRLWLARSQTQALAIGDIRRIGLGMIRAVPPARNVARELEADSTLRTVTRSAVRRRTSGLRTRPVRSPGTRGMSACGASRRV